MQTRQQFDSELIALEDTLISMYGRVENAVFSSLTALEQRDLKSSRKIIKRDRHINDMENQIEARCIELLRREAPLAGDLRRIMAVLFIAGELERMGDYAKGIASISVIIGKIPIMKDIATVQEIASIAMRMANRSMQAFTERDSEKVTADGPLQYGDDRQLGTIYKALRKNLISTMKKEPAQVEQATYLLWVAHNLERIGDRSLNVLGRVAYRVLGEPLVHNLTRDKSRK